jgi:pimeloyl-ACP methyl ester carboxylesterase
MPFFEFSPSCQIHYLDENSSSPDSVLLLHGLGANSNSWILQTPALHQAGFRTIAPDTPGFGQSTYPDGGASISRFFEPIAALVEHLQPRRINIVGISMGGTLALQLALDHPQYVSRLVLVNTFAHLNISSPRLLPYLLTRFILVHTLGIPTQAKAVAKRIFPYPEQEVLRQGLIEQVNQADPHAYRAAMRALARFDVRRRLREIRCPTLVVTGDRDTTVPLDAQRELVETIPGAYQRIIPAAGHGVTVEKPDAFNQTLVEFLCS